MSDITKHEPSAVSAAALEHILGTGDLSKLTTQQRVEYYGRTCQSLGLNPLTRPFRFLALNGQIQLYATKDCTDQLRTVRGITLHIVDKQIDSGLYIVTARARTKDGREDEDIGAVTLPRDGESRANALMKGTTKAKRRVTLSICGLGGMPDESELDGMPGARTFDAEDDPPVAPIRAVATEAPRGERKVAPKTEVYDPNKMQSELARVLPPDQLAGVEAWLVGFQVKLDRCQTRAELDLVVTRPVVTHNLENGPEAMQREMNLMIAAAYDRLPAAPRETPDDLEIAGADKLAAG